MFSANEAQQRAGSGEGTKNLGLTFTLHYLNEVDFSKTMLIGPGTLTSEETSVGMVWGLRLVPAALL